MTRGKEELEALIFVLFCFEFLPFVESLPVKHCAGNGKNVKVCKETPSNFSMCHPKQFLKGLSHRPVPTLDLLIRHWRTLHTGSVFTLAYLQQSPKSLMLWGVQK